MRLHAATRRLAVATLVAGVLGTGQAALATTKSVTTHLTLHSTQASYHVGAPVVLTGVATPPTKASITVQRLVGKKWTTVAHAKPNRSGSFTVTLKAPSKATSWSLRAVRGATTGVKAGTSTKVKTPVVKAIYVITAKTAVQGQSVTLSGSVTPKAKGSVVVQTLDRGTWVNVATVKLTPASTFAFTTVKPAGSFALRVVRAATLSVAGRIGGTLHVTVAAPAPPAPGALAVTSATLPEGTVGLAYSQQLAAINGTQPYTWSAPAGVLPAGVTLSPAGLLAGTPTTITVASFLVTVTDATHAAASAVVTVRFSLSPTIINTVAAWGTSRDGSTGNFDDDPTPVAVGGLNGVTQLAAGDSNLYAVRFDGTVWAMGSDNAGQVTQVSHDGGTATPVAVPGLTHITQVSADGDSAIALRSDGTVLTWGDGEDGQHGDGSKSFKLGAFPVPGLTGIVAVASGDVDNVALAGNGTVWVWGNNSNGQLGNGTTTDSYTPIEVPGLSDVVAIDASAFETVALKSDGTVWDWGSNAFNETAPTGSNIYNLSPVQVPGLTGITEVSAGATDTYARASDGTVWAWGRNEVGQLGNGAINGAAGPVHLPLTGVASVNAGFESVCATMADGTVRTWGSDKWLVIGAFLMGNAYTDSPVAPAVPGHVLSCDAGEFDMYALISN